MNSEVLVQKLRLAAEILKPFTSRHSPGTRVWNGTTYAPASDSPFDPYALCWWGSLSTAASLIEAQGHPISRAQRDYLERELFGGMGSLRDFQLDVKVLGERAREANAQLDRALDDIFREFENA